MTSNSYKYQPSDTDDELLAVVDEHDQVIGQATRREIHLNKLRHRAVHAVVINRKGEILLQKRSKKKDSHPGYWDISMGGHVDAGEEYEEAARREIREELGIDAPLQEVARREAAPDSGWEFVRLYEVHFDGDVNFNRNEIDEIAWVSLDDFFRLYQPVASDKNFLVTGSGLLSITRWAEATRRR